jgi:uncharacterized membrane protein
MHRAVRPLVLVALAAAAVPACMRPEPPPGPATTTTTTTSSSSGTTSTTTTGSPACPAPGHCPRPFPPPGAENPLAHVDVTGINATGTVIGYGRSRDGEAGGLVWSPDGRSRRLGSPYGRPGYRPPPGGTGAAPADINAAGQVVGLNLSATDLPSRPLFWEADGAVVPIADRLPTYGGTWVAGSASGINDAGVVVGSYALSLPADGPGGAARTVDLGFVWDSATDRLRIIDPPFPGGGSPAVALRDINAAGVIVGTRAGVITRWTPRPDGTYRAERLEPGAAVGVNDHGEALIERAGGRPARWPAGAGAAVDLPGLPDGRPDDEFEATGLNNRGDVVGAIVARDYTRFTPVWWPHGATTAQPLGSITGLPTSARAVNDAGTIVGVVKQPVSESGPTWRGIIWD